MSTAIIGGNCGDNAEIFGGKIVNMSHADEIQVVAIGGNMGKLLSHVNIHFTDDNWKLEAVKQLASQLGFDLKKREGRSI